MATYKKMWSTREEELEILKKVRDNLLARFEDYNHEWESIPDTISWLYRNPEIWSKFDFPGMQVQNFETFWDFVEAPRPAGLNTTKEIIIAICGPNKNGFYPTDKEGNVVLDILMPERTSGKGTKSDAGKKGGRGNKANGNTNSFTENNKHYKLNRLKRERPDIARRVIDGEISANRGYIEAGFALKKVTVPVSVDGYLKSIKKNLSVEDLEKLKDLL